MHIKAENWSLDMHESSIFPASIYSPPGFLAESTLFHYLPGLPAWVRQQAARQPILSVAVPCREV
jgi:hypothetical protein